MEFLDPAISDAIKNWYEARIFARNSKPEDIIATKAPKDSTLAEYFGTAKLLRWLWDNISSFRKFFENHRVSLNTLENNVFVSRLLMLWDFDHAYVQHVCIVFDHASIEGLRMKKLMDRAEYWFCQKTKTVCQELYKHKLKEIVPCRDYRPYTHHFMTDVRCEVGRWKRWYIVDIVDDTSSRSRATTEKRQRDVSPVRSRGEPEKRQRDASPERSRGATEKRDDGDHRADLQIFQNILNDKLKNSNDKIGLIKKLTVALVQL